MNIGRVAITLVVFFVVAAIACGGWYFISQVYLEGGRQTREAEAAQALKGLGVIVVVEPGTKRASTVNFCGKPVAQEQLEHLKNLHRLGVLMVSGSELPEGFMETASQMGSVNSLALSGTSVSGKELNKIARMSNLDSLYLKKVAVTDENLDAIGSLGNVKILDLSDTDITDAGLAKLASMRGLHWLLLSGTDVTDKGLLGLSEMNLKRLTLYDTAVTAEAVKQLGERWPKAKIDTGNRPAEEKIPEEKTSEEQAEKTSESDE